MDVRPLLSVAVPTRNRPRFLRQALLSLHRQTFPDLEVIVCDNSDAPSPEPVADLLGGMVRWVRPPSMLAMHDNWEFAVTQARGEHVAVMIDKTVWLPTTAETAARELQKTDADLVSWWQECYRPDDEDTALEPGTYYPTSDHVSQPTRFEGIDELRLRFSFDRRREALGPHWYRGKICFGFYRRDLVQRIVAAQGRLFLPVSPDYTSMLGALALVRCAVDLGRPLQLAYLSRVSNGSRVQFDAESARGFLDSLDVDGGLIRDLPIPGLYSSQHIVIASDYVRGARLHHLADRGVALDMANLVVRAREDLACIRRWSDGEELARQQAILRDAAAALPGRVAAASRTRAVLRSRMVRGYYTLAPWADRVRPARDLLRWLRGRPPIRRSSSIHSAADAAEARAVRRLASAG